MADTSTNTGATIGLLQILVGPVAEDGNMPATSNMTKVGMVYKGTCTTTQDASERTEHYEEGRTVPVVINKSKNTPKVSFSLIVDDLQILVDTLGGELIMDSSGNVTGWGINGDELPGARSFKLVTKQGVDIEIPNGDIDANLNSSLTQDGIFLVEVVVTPLSVTSGKAFRVAKKTTASA